MPNAADIIATRLYQAGCRHAFGVPGCEVLTLIDALATAGIEFILTKHGLPDRRPGLRWRIVAPFRFVYGTPEASIISRIPGHSDFGRR